MASSTLSLPTRTYQVRKETSPSFVRSIAFQEGPFDPAVDAAAAYAVQELSSRSNSLFPFQLKNVLSATKTHGAGLDTVEGGGSGSPREGVTHHLKLVVSRGQQPDEQYEIDVGEATHGFVLRGVHGPL